jgi:hypothetical protein
MPADLLTTEVRRENAAALAAALGLGIVEATELLDVTIVVTASQADKTAVAIADDISELLGRTARVITAAHEVASAVENPSGVAAELVIGDATGRTGARKLFLSVSLDAASLSRTQLVQDPCAPLHRLLCAVIACYACAATLDCALNREGSFGVPDPMVISYDALGIDAADLATPVELGHAYLAGAGAIGNGLLWAARHLDVRGRLELVDDDVVDPGNLNRQVWFGSDDIGEKKVERLALKAQSSFPRLELIPRPWRLQDLPEKSDGPWLRRLIVAVDSRRARRQLQNEFPGEVFDASTTDIREIVVHYNRQPTTQACLCCIYEPDQEELAREQHIADHLGVSVEQARSERITAPAAAAIIQRFPALSEPNLVGMAYDTLFKRLCGEGQLKTATGRRVVAPFAFVSALAGALLALELARRLGAGRSDRDFNYWRVSAWHPPLARRRLRRPRQQVCAFCGNAVLRRVNSTLWPA